MPAKSIGVHMRDIIKTTAHNNMTGTKLCIADAIYEIINGLQGTRDENADGTKTLHTITIS